MECYSIAHGDRRQAQRDGREGARAMIRGLHAAAAAAALMLTAASSMAEEPFRLELNAAEAEAGKCRLSFVVENPSAAAIDALKLDLAIFGRDGAIRRRLLTEMAPVRPR